MKKSGKPIQEFKVCCIESQGAGKTSLMLRFVEDPFEQNTISTLGASFLTKIIEFKDYDVKFQIWDTVGQERFGGLARHYYRGAAVGIIVYDITSQQQFDETKSWVLALKEHADSPDDIIIAIVGNKRDKEELREVSTQQGELYAKSIGAIFMETSALTGYHVEYLLDEIVKKLPNDYDVPLYIEDISKLLDKPPSKKSGCCG